MVESYERRTLISNVATLLARRVISGAAAAAAAASGLTTEHRHRPRNNTAALEQPPPRLSRPGRSSFPCCYIIHAAVRLHG